MRLRWHHVALAAGLALAAWQWGGAAWLAGKAVLAQELLDRAWQEHRSSGNPEPPWPWADFSPAARLSAPGLGVTRIVLGDASPRTLAFGPGLLPESRMPGGDGAVVLAGHRDSHFRFLRRLEPGAEIRLETRDGDYRYRVTATRVLDTRRDRLRLDGPERLVLVTCWPFDALQAGGPMRYLVVAERLEPDADSFAASEAITAF